MILTNMKIIEKDLLTVESGIICHQCNCLGSMGGGIALAIKNKWPVVYRTYRDTYDRQGLRLGEIQLVKVSDNLIVCNMMCQKYFGREPRLYTDYDAVRTAFKKLHDTIGRTTQIYIPMNMGCGLAGGDWNEYSRIVDFYCPGVIACKL